MPRTVVVFLFLLLLLLTGLAGYTQNSISGQIKNLPPGKLQLMQEEDLNRKKSRPVALIPVDSKGRFKYTGRLSPHIYSLKIADNKSLMLALDKDQKVQINGDMLRPDSWNISGSADTKLLMEYEAYRKASLDSLVSSVRRQIKKLEQQGIADNDSSMSALTKLEVINYERHRDDLIQFVVKRMGTSIAVYPTTIRWGGAANIEQLTRLAAAFQKAHPNTEIAKRVNEKVRVISATSIGGKAVDIRLNDTLGIPVQLSAINGRYTLIDFWASWCTPCRKESPMLSELYQKYKQAGFEIYGISLDTDRERWLKAIEKDNRSWLNVSSLQGFETPAAFDYAVTALPTNILIDKTGKVIARDVHGDELHKLLEKLFL